MYVPSQRVHVGTGLVVERASNDSSRWVKLREDLWIFLHGLIDDDSSQRLGITVKAFTSDSKYRSQYKWDAYYAAGHKPDLVQHGLTAAEQETVDKAAREFAPLIPLWKELDEATTKK